jgi:hypothetical protein
LEEVVSGVLALTAGEAEGLKPPEFNMEAGAIFTVTLRNTPVYPPETLRWLKQFDGYDLSPNQRRLLAYAHAHGGQFTSRSYQKFAGVHLYTALETSRISSARAWSISLKRGPDLQNPSSTGGIYPEDHNS